MQPLPTSPAVVAGPTLRLRGFGEQDLPQLRLAFADPDVARWNPGPIDSVEEWLAARSDWSSGGHATWAVADTGGLLGYVSLHHVDATQDDAEIGYWVAPWARGGRVGATAVGLATRWAFSELGLHRVYLYHAVENPASCAVARAAGFRLEGTLIRSYRQPGSDFHDEHLHALLSEEALG